MRVVIGAGLAALLVAVSATAATGSSGSPLTGKLWVVSTLAGKALVPGTDVTAEFTAKGQVAGSGGCNRFSGTYKVTGSSIRITPGASTQMACATRIMAQERAYFAALAKTRAFTVSGVTLTLKGQGGRVLATYKVQSQALGGTSWEVIAYNNGKEAVVSTISETEITAVFGKDGTLAGVGGCNDYHATYTAKAPKLTIGPVAATRKACGSPDGVMEQEARYLAALETVTTYRVEGSRLQLRTATGALAVDLRRH